MTIVTQNGAYPRVTEILKISDTAEGNGVYKLEIKIQYRADEEPEQVDYLSRPNDPYGVNPQIRQWMNENPDAPVHAYVPPPEKTEEELREQMQPLTARQFRLGLVAGGKTPSQVDAAIAVMPEGPDKETAKIEWEYATTFRRTHPLVVSLGSALGLSAAAIDSMWDAAKNL